MITSIIAPPIGNLAMDFTPAKLLMIILIGIFNSTVSKIPNNPAQAPIIKVSALNTHEISFLEAPILLKMPISFFLSSTDI